jgi:hypothetical protein
MKDANDRLKEWNDALAEGERLASQLRAKIIRMNDGFLRRAGLRLLRFTENWIARGKRWRREDLE